MSKTTRDQIAEKLDRLAARRTFLREAVNGLHAHAMRVYGDINTGMLRVSGLESNGSERTEWHVAADRQHLLTFRCDFDTDGAPVIATCNVDALGADIAERGGLSS
jgi:hypothetical protein